ncbi:carbon starvation CstA family protein [Shigella flexneri]
MGLWAACCIGRGESAGRRKSLWQLFSIPTRCWQVVALVLGTVVLIKMKRTRYVWVTVVPGCMAAYPPAAGALGPETVHANPQMRKASLHRSPVQREDC